MIIVKVWTLREAYYSCILESLDKIVEHGIDGNYQIAKKYEPRVKVKC
jgi:hypothetical protein